PSLTSYAFTYQTAGLAAGVTVYRPAVGDILWDAWIATTTAFNGTTPLADISQFTGSAAPLGLWGDYASALDLSLVDTINVGGGPRGGGSTGNKNRTLTAASGGGTRPVPGIFTTTDALKLVVSQDGTQGGTAVGGTAGAATLYLLTLRPDPA